jgi:DUF1680 family protein
MHLRLPGWCENYHLSINGTAVTLTADENGYLQINRTWQNGDTLTYEMDMPIRPVWANPAVRQLEGRVALQRGPLVYCLEGCDHGGIILDRIALDPANIASGFQTEYRADLLGGVVLIRGKGQLIDDAGWNEDLYRSVQPSRQEIEIRAVPYCVWDNREPGEMRVWLRTESGS